MKIVIEDARSDIFQLSSGQDTNYPDNIRALQLDRDNNLWVGTKMVDYIVMIVNII